MTSLQRLTWIIYSWCCAKILKFYFFANSITLWEAHKKETTHCIQVLNVQDKLYITFVYSDIHVAI